MQQIFNKIYYTKECSTRNKKIAWCKHQIHLKLCVSSLRRGHANLLCIGPILVDVPSEEEHNQPTGAYVFKGLIKG
jgi:hypothetical protein